MMYVVYLAKTRPGTGSKQLNRFKQAQFICGNGKHDGFRWKSVPDKIKIFVSTQIR